VNSIFVTGAKGFVGSHLPGVLSFTGDLRDFDQVKKEMASVKPSSVIHLAAQSHVGYALKNPKETYEVNFLGTFHLLEALREVGFQGRFLYVSSADVYESKERPLKETDRTNPMNPYSVSKAAAEMLCLQEKAFDVIIARPFNHIGPGQNASFALPAFAKQLKAIQRGEQPPVLQVGNLETTRDFCDVRDIVRGYLLLLEKGQKGEIYNLCSGRAQQMKDVLKRLIAISGLDVTIATDPNLVRGRDQKRIVGSFNKIYQHTGWQPTIALEESLKAIWETA
jgi:GDP-4-dehydro-6-deoxy-D-mannose reductase